MQHAAEVQGLLREAEQAQSKLLRDAADVQSRLVQEGERLRTEVQEAGAQASGLKGECRRQGPRHPASRVGAGADEMLWGRRMRHHRTEARCQMLLCSPMRTGNRALPC